MADKTSEQVEAPKAEAAEQTTDWEAKYRAMAEHSREWERKAKANKGAADELEKLKASQMTDLERAQREAKEAKAKLAAIEAESERQRLAAEVSKDADVPMDVLTLDLTTEDGMRQLAKRWAEGHRVPSAPRVSAPGSFASDAGAKDTPLASFSRFMDENFRK